MEIPYPGKAIINETYAGLEIIIPPQRNWVVIIFLGFWLMGWLVGELLTLGVITGLIPSDTGSGKFFLLLWLGGWTAGGVFAIKAFVENLSGKEIVTVEHGELTVEKKYLFFSKSKSYSLEDAKNFRTKNGTVQFNYGLQTVSIAEGIDDAEATYILTTLKKLRLLTDNNF